MKKFILIVFIVALYLAICWAITPSTVYFNWLVLLIYMYGGIVYFSKNNTEVFKVFIGVGIFFASVSALALVVHLWIYQFLDFSPWHIASTAIIYSLCSLAGIGVIKSENNSVVDNLDCYKNDPY